LYFIFIYIIYFICLFFKYFFKFIFKFKNVFFEFFDFSFFSISVFFFLVVFLFLFLFFRQQFYKSYFWLTPNYVFLLVFSKFEDIDFFFDHFNTELDEGDFLEDCTDFGSYVDEFEVNLVSNRAIVKKFLKNNRKNFSNLSFFFDQKLDLYTKDLNLLKDETLDYEVEDFLI